MKKVAILMSTYNGDKYIVKQLDSIYNQTFKNIKVFIRDDGSDKSFIEKLNQLKEKYDFELVLGKNIGFVGSFFELLESAQGFDLYSFADQDDYWFPHKIELAVKWFEKYGDENTPMLFHSAYNNMDVNTGKTHLFYFPNKSYSFRRSITENHYSGFSMTINSKMRDYMLLGDYTKIGYHDWWAAMIAHSLGKGYSDGRVMAIHYTHGKNYTTFNIKTRFEWLIQNIKKKSDISCRTKEFYNCFGDRLKEPDRRMLELFVFDKYDLFKSIKKAFYVHRWRPIISSEIVIRMLMLIGRI
ncbi:MAG: glycosyltransferase [Eubacterium sp.]|nr:glycosyltransferase [Eubacterium sp.]